MSDLELIERKLVDLENMMAAVSRIRVPNGYLQTDRAISDADAQRIRQRWAEAQANGTTVIMGNGVRFVEFGRDRWPKAICTYCGSANLAVSVECAKCGAPMIE